MKETKRRREPSKRSANSPSGCRPTLKLKLRTCETFFANLSWRRRTLKVLRLNIRRSIVPKLIKMKEMSNSNRKLPSQRINRRKSRRRRRRPNPSQRLPEALQVRARPKRGRLRSSCQFNRSSEIIQVRHPKNSLR